MNIDKIKKLNTKKIGKEIEYFEEIGSTHSYAKQMAEKNQNDGKVILAEIQTSGIGTKGRSWYTGSGKNIAMTIIFQPKCKINELEGLTIKIAKIIQNVIKQMYNYDLEIKEPNDLMINDKKICGILTEINTIGDKINYLLISIGFNVNEENFSEETKEIATSLKQEYHKHYEREEIIIKILENLEKEIEN